MLQEFEHLNAREYDNIVNLIGGYRVEPHLRKFKKTLKEEVDYGIECGTGGNPELLKILTGSPFVCMKIPFDYDAELASRGVATGYDAQTMAVDTLWMSHVNFALTIETSSKDYYIYIPVSAEGCLDAGIKHKGIRGGSVWYDAEAETPVMYQLKLNSIEKAKYGQAAKLCKSRWDAFDEKHGFIRDENDLACHRDGTRVSAEEMAAIMQWDFLGDFIKEWKERDADYMDRWGDIYETGSLSVEQNRNKGIEAKTAYDGRPFGDWTREKETVSR